MLLPFNFWYYGMTKIKAGKGYRENGRGYGVIGGPCKECEGTVISIKMNTSRKGMEVTSEKVCDTCGLVVPGAFQTLEPRPPYKGRYFNTHEDWLEHARGVEPDFHGADMWHENAIHLFGGEYEPTPFSNRYDHNPRLALAIKRLANTPASIKTPRHITRQRQYMLIVDDCAHALDLLPYQVVDVKYILEHDTGLSKWPYKMEDVIYELCLIVGNKDLRKYQSINRRLYDLLTDRLGR